MNKQITLKSSDDLIRDIDELNEKDNNTSKPKTTVDFESAADLLARSIPEQKWAVNGLLSEGAMLFAGSPKTGKSFLALGLAVAIACGGRALGSLPVEQGDVLYVALEDGDRRIQKRLMTMIKSSVAPERLDFAFKFPRINEGGLEIIERWLQEHSEARLVVLDTLKRIRPSENRSNRIYDGDYDAVAPLNDLAQKYGVSILIIHHTNKLTGNEDWFDSISGSLGLSGAVDNAMLLRRPRGRSKGTLHFGGRDIEDKDLAIEFDSVICSWKLLGNALTNLAQKIEGWLVEAGEQGLSRSEINRKNGGRSEGVADALTELKDLERAQFRMKPTSGKAQERWYTFTQLSSIDDNNDFDDESYHSDEKSAGDVDDIDDNDDESSYERMCNNVLLSSKSSLSSIATNYSESEPQNSKYSPTRAW